MTVIFVATGSQMSRKGLEIMPEDNPRASGKAVKHLRQNLGWTQEDLANRVGCVKRTIENVESEKRISWKILSQVAEALDVTLEKLRLPEGDPPAEANKDTVEEMEIECPQAAPGDAERGGNVAVTTGTAKLEIVLDRDFDSFTGEEQSLLVSMVKLGLELTGNVRVVSKRRAA